MLSSALSQAEKIRGEVEKEISAGPSNFKKKGDSVSIQQIQNKGNTVEFYRDVRDYIACSSDLQEGVSVKDILCNAAFISAAFTQLYKTGGCGEYSDLAFVKFLIEGISFSIEKIRIEDKTSKRNHAFLILNKNQNSDITDLKEWKDIIYFDIWPVVGKVDKYSGSTIFTKSVLLNPLIKHVDSIQSVYRVETNFTAEKWQKMSKYFNDAASITDEATINKLLKKNNLNNSAKSEHKIIYEKLIQTAKEYQQLSEKTKLLEHQSTGPSHSFFSASASHETICARLKSITDLDWKYYPANPKSSVDQALLISEDKIIIENVIKFFKKHNLKLNQKRIEKSTPVKYVAQFLNVTLELEKLKNIQPMGKIDPSLQYIK